MMIFEPQPRQEFLARRPLRYGDWQTEYIVKLNTETRFKTDQRNLYSRISFATRKRTFRRTGVTTKPKTTSDWFKLQRFAFKTNLTTCELYRCIPFSTRKRDIPTYRESPPNQTKLVSTNMFGPSLQQQRNTPGIEGE